MKLIPKSVAEMVAVGLLPYPVKSIEEHKGGLINHTFKIVTKNDTDPNFLLQKVNSYIFKDVDLLQSNIRIVTDYIRNELDKQSLTNLNRRVLSPGCILSNGECKSYYWDHDCDYWRLYEYIEDSKSYNAIPNNDMAFKGGVTLASFHKTLLDFPKDKLPDIIPNFHNLKKRIESLMVKIKDDKFGRVTNAKKEIEFINDNIDEYIKLYEILTSPNIPKRVIHQDPKFNNILFDLNDNPLCMVDLDTVMVGHLYSDIGDAIRTGANSTVEDNPDLNQTNFIFETYQSYINGYLSIAKDFITLNELHSIYISPLIMTYEQSIRFLSDYINGDKYYKYKTEYPDHNLIRAKNQIRLFEQMVLNREKLKDTVINFDPSFF